MTSADCDVHGRATGQALCDGNAQLGGPSSNRRCTVAHPPRDLAGKHSRARQPSQGLVFNFGPADSLAQALPPMSPVPIASCAATTAATSKHDARGVLIRIGKQGPGVPRRPGRRTAVRRPRLTVTHTPAVVESESRFDGAKPFGSCTRDTAAARRLKAVTTRGRGASVPAPSPPIAWEATPEG